MHSEKQKFPRDTRQKYHFISFPPACQIFTALRPPPEGKEGGAGVGRGVSFCQLKRWVLNAIYPSEECCLWDVIPSDRHRYHPHVLLALLLPERITA